MSRLCLHILQGAKVTRRSTGLDEIKVTRAGRTLEEARKLIEQSFGNYVGSNVMLAAKEELARIEKEIETLTSEVSEEAIDRKSQKLLTPSAYQENAKLQKELRVISLLLPLIFYCLKSDSLFPSKGTFFLVLITY